jgi:PIF1-like helicase
VPLRQPSLKVAIPANDGTFCSLSGPERTILHCSDLIIWDEASLIHEDVADTVNRTLQDIMSDYRPFGGKTVLFTGDFKQLLPVVRGGRGDDHTLQQCAWWPTVRRIVFSRNFRAAEDDDFALLLEEIGNGRMMTVEVPEQSSVASIPELVHRVYGENLSVAESGCMILTLTLKDAAVINDYCLDQCSGGCHRRRHHHRHYQHHHRHHHHHNIIIIISSSFSNLQVLNALLTLRTCL